MSPQRPAVAPAVALLLAAAAVRAPLLTQNRFHPDEALYASFGRLIASGRDPMLSGVLVDKPPLGFYALAGSFALFGPSEFAARLPGFAAGLIGVALLYRLSLQLCRSPASAAASAALLALSPLAILFSATLFLDTLVNAFLLWSLLSAARGRAGWAGTALGLAFLVKQSALLFLPLVAALEALANAPRKPWGQSGGWRWGAAGGGTLAGGGTAGRAHTTLRDLSVIALATAVAALLAFAWDGARHADIGFWRQGYSDNAPDRLIRSGELLPRLRAWGNLLHYLAVSRAVELLSILGIGAVAARALKRPARWANAVALTFVTFSLLYLAAYWLLAFNVWDRYLVALLPVLCLLAGWGVTIVASPLTPNPSPLRGEGRQRHGALRGRLPSPLWGEGPGMRGDAAFLPAITLALLLAIPAVQASQSKFPVGGDHGSYDGIDEMAAYLQTLPLGSVLYDHWLSWEWRFYLFDSPTFLVWMPSPGALAEDLAVFGHSPVERFIVVPGWESAAEWEASAAEAGFSMRPVHVTRDRHGDVSFTLYQFQPQTSNPIPNYQLPIPNL